MELIFVADLFWQAYLPKQEIGLSECEIDDLVDELLDAENVNRYLHKLEYLNFTKTCVKPEIGKGKIDEALMMFLKQFGVTVLLVIEEYFKNPYSKDTEPTIQLKRSFNFKDISND
jgi:hypothetical protein